MQSEIASKDISMAQEILQQNILKKYHETKTHDIKMKKINNKT